MAEWIAVAAVPAIINQAQFDRAQERLRALCGRLPVSTANEARSCVMQ
jgi:hypothetical protein